MSNRRREERERERICMAAIKARAAASSAKDATANVAMDAALAQIGAAFDEAAALNRFKIRIERYIRLGPGHIAMRARYGARAERLRGRSLDAAIALTERWWREERQAFAIASAFGRGSRLSLDVLRELRVMLRLMRWKRMQVEFGAIVAAAGGDEAMRTAAE